MTLIPRDAVSAAEFIVRHMYRAIDLAEGAPFFAVSETENPIGGDVWFWSDDNAKVLELLSRPELWRRFPRQTTEIFRFIKVMCHGPFIFRRVSPPRLELTEKQGPINRYRHSLMNIACDLSRGAVVAGIRFHDERNFDHLLLTGNRVEFTYAGRNFRLVVEAAISDVQAVEDDGVLTLRYAGDLHFTPAWRERRLGRITYTYTIEARSTLIEVEAALEIDPGIRVSDVVLTIGHDQLGQYLYSTICADSQPSSRPLLRAGAPGRHGIDMARAAYYQIRWDEGSGDALAVHSIPREPNRLGAMEVVVRQQGKLHWALTRYEFPGPQQSVKLVAGEHKLLTAGGFYERISDYASFMRRALANKATEHAAWDISISYDYGSKLNAFAKCFAVCATADLLPTPPDLQEQLRATFDEYLTHYFNLFVEVHAERQNVIYSRDLSFVILGLVTMYRATGDASYLGRLRRLCDILLEFEIQFADVTGEPASAFLMRMNSPRVAYVDCHSAAILALTQASRYVCDSRLVAAIERALSAYCLETCAVPFGRPLKVDTVSTVMVDGEGTRRTENAFWNFKAGMTLRCFAALRNSPNPAVQSVVARHRDRMELFESILLRQIERSITERAGSIEVRTAVPAAETNSETQPWVMLGLFGHPLD